MVPNPGAPDSKVFSRRGNVPKLGRLMSTAYGLAVLASLIAFTGGGGVWPPEDNPLWTLSWLLGGSAIALALVASRLDGKDVGTRRSAAVAIGISSLAYLMSCYWRYETWHDLPWPPLALWVLGLGVSGWFCSQKAWAVVAPLVVALWLGPGLLPARNRLPVSVSSGDLTLSIPNPDPASGRSRSLRFVLATRSGKPLGQSYDLRNATVSGSAGVLGIKCWQPTAMMYFEDGAPAAPNKMEFSSATFVPPWLRSWDVRIVVPMWPAESSGHVRVQIPNASSAGTGARDPNSKVGLSVSGPADSHTLKVESTIYPGGLGPDTWRSLRIKDDRQRIIAFRVRAFPPGSVGLELDPVVKDAKYLDIDLYTPAQRSSAETVFTISRLSTSP